MPRPTIIFDTSALNQLAVHADVNSLICVLIREYRIWITEINLVEIAATSDATERRNLIRMIRVLVSSEQIKGILPPNEIIEKQFKQFRKRPQSYDWKLLDIRSRVFEKAFSTEGAIDDTVATLQREDAKTSANEFEEMMKAIRLELDSIRGNNDQVPSLSSLLVTGQETDGPFWALCRIVLSRNGQNTPEQRVRPFYDACPPFQSFVSTLFVALYDRTIRPIKAPRIAKTGRVDIFQSVYLPYCASFISSDKGQIDVFKIVEKFLGSVPIVVHWDDFLRRL